jgi:hypothetical protein
MRLILALLMLSLSVSAEAPAPKLTTEQRLVLANLILTRDNAQLKLDAFVQSITVPGFDLTTAGDYVAKAPEPKATP